MSDNSGGPSGDDEGREERVVPRSNFRLLLDPMFGPFFVGKLLSSMGMWIHNVVAAILVFQMTRSTFLVGLVSVAQFMPQMLFAPLSGAMADRGDRKRQLIVGRTIASTGSGGLAVWIALVGVDGLPGAWPVILAALMVGCGFVIGHPAMHSLVPALVREEELASAIALSSLPFTIARSAGPAIGAFVLIGFGAAPAFALAAAGNLAFALFLLPVHPPAREVSSSRKDRSVRAGLRYLKVDKVLIVLLIGVGAIGIGADPVITLSPALAEMLGQGEEFVGVLASLFGVGAGLSIVFLRRLRLRFPLQRLGVTGLMVQAVGLASASLAMTAPVALASYVVMGVGMTLGLTSLSTLLQERLSDAFRGRVMALWVMFFQGSRPLAAFLHGTTADVFSVRPAFLIAITVLVAAAVLCRPSRTGGPAPLRDDG